MLGMVQVIMMFAQPFWPADFFDVVCTDSFIPEFWVTCPPLLTPTRPLPASEHTGLHDAGNSTSSPQHAQHAQQQQSAEPPVHCMVGFVAGSKAEEISKLRQNSVVIQTLSQLDQMFGKPHLFCSQLSDLALHGGLPAFCIWLETQFQEQVFADVVSFGQLELRIVLHRLLPVVEGLYPLVVAWRVVVCVSSISSLDEDILTL